MGDDGASDDDERAPPDGSAPFADAQDPVNAMFEMLASHRRRYVLYCLTDHDGPVDVEALSSQVAEWENEMTDVDSSDSVQKRVYVNLAHSDLPKLADFGVVDYDTDDGTVSLRADVEILDRYLDIARDGEMRD